MFSTQRLWSLRSIRKWISFWVVGLSSFGENKYILHVEEKRARKVSDFKRFPAAHPSLFLFLLIHIDDISYPLCSRYGLVTLPVTCEEQCWGPYSDLAHRKHSNLHCSMFIPFLLDRCGWVNLQIMYWRQQNTKSRVRVLEFLLGRNFCLLIINFTQIRNEYQYFWTFVHFEVCWLCSLALPYITYLKFSIHLTFWYDFPIKVIVLLVRNFLKGK